MGAPMFLRTFWTKRLTAGANYLDATCDPKTLKFRHCSSKNENKDIFNWILTAIVHITYRIPDINAVECFILQFDNHF